MGNELEQTKGNALQQIESTPITKETIKKYICPEATDQELVYFLELCKGQGLNPFLKEAYLVKYGNFPASQIVAKDVFFKRANKQPDYKGYKAGVIVDRKGSIEYLLGAFCLKTDTILGGWAEVYRKDKEPVRIEVSFEEYAGKTKDGKLNKQWATKPATMIRKVPIVQALREAYPEEFQGMYDEAELGAIKKSQKEQNQIDMPKAKSPKTIEVDEEEEKVKKERSELFSQIMGIAQEKFGADGAKAGIMAVCQLETFSGVDIPKLQECVQKLASYKVEESKDQEQIEFGE